MSIGKLTLTKKAKKKQVELAMNMLLSLGDDRQEMIQLMREHLDRIAGEPDKG